MDITADPDTSTREVYRVMRQFPGQPKARVWNTCKDRPGAVAEIRKQLAESAEYWQTHERKVRFGIQHAVITEVTDTTEWEPEECFAPEAEAEAGN